MKKNETFQIKITGMTSEGNGVGRTDGGMAVFVPHTAVGDIIECKIVKVTKSCAYGIISKIIEPSCDRMESCCPVSSKCGGCTFRHIYLPTVSYSRRFFRKLYRSAFPLRINIILNRTMKKTAVVSCGTFTSGKVSTAKKSCYALL